MNRFHYSKQNSFYRNYIVSIIVFLLIILVFYSAISSVSSRTDAEQKVSLERALQRSVIHCYSIEGSYPESLDYLKKHYGIVYDTQKFFVDYQVLGTNIMPDITIIEKEVP
ncbi:MAG: hypothetical protein PHX08_25950 [Lachnospiraceae bacterium]|nr:hypothetical protein [Lachnospiraceae bacterium]